MECNNSIRQLLSKYLHSVGVKVFAILNDGKVVIISNAKIVDDVLLNNYFLDWKGDPIRIRDISMLEIIS